MAASKSPVTDQPAGLPLFYQRPIVVNSEVHAAAKFKRIKPDIFARKSPFVPLIIQDILEAAKHYPIVFTQDEFPVPVALVGLEQDNYFIDCEGQWDPQRYTPAYVRNYPFLFAKAPGDELLLCIDEPGLASAEDESGLPLFEEGKVSSFTLEALGFCKAYQDNRLRTEEFCTALARKGVLSLFSSKVELKNSRTIEGRTFQLIDPEAIQKLSDDDIVEWHKNGYLALIGYIRQSLSNWQNLIDYASKFDETRSSPSIN